MSFRFPLLLSALPALLSTAIANASVTEPNGEQVPILKPSDQYTETSLQSYFDTNGESLDAVTQASAEPGTFSPMCGFHAELVLSESGGKCGIAWYNVPSDANAAPDVLYQIIEPTSERTATGTINSADIINSENYKGGLIGFAITNESGIAIYYSEHLRNPVCVDYTNATDGYTCLTTGDGRWIASLAYPSTALGNTYYLAFEDWGLDNGVWHNDGDFNDKVFRLTGVSCLGGGEACTTSLSGACSVGITQCGVGGVIECKQQVQATTEQCDNVDNDCNGQVDDGDLCAANQICFQGQCVPTCAGGEFSCPDGYTCNTTGYCVDPSCTGVECTAGLTCHNGACIDACTGIVCPGKQDCQLGRCVDTCAGITCPEHSVCEHGACVANCACRPCTGGKVCGTDGHCYESGCETVTCPDGQICSGGSCVDACLNAVCPGNATCTNGQCGTPTPETDAGAGTGGSSFGSGGSGANSGNGSANTDGTSSSSGCGCRTVGTPSSQGWLFPLLSFLGILGILRHRQSKN